jgi:hypothetical protein
MARTKGTKRFSAADLAAQTAAHLPVLKADLLTLPEFYVREMEEEIDELRRKIAVIKSIQPELVEQVEAVVCITGARKLDDQHRDRLSRVRDGYLPKRARMEKDVE